MVETPGIRVLVQNHVMRKTLFIKHLPLVAASLFAVTMLPIVNLASGQDVSVVAHVDQTTIGTEEALTYTIEISGVSANQVRTPSPPSAEGLELLQSVPSTQSSVSIVNGVMEQSYSFRWAFRPTAQGDATIASTSVIAAGSTFQTEEIAITVVPQSQRPARSQQSSRRLDPFSTLFRSPFDDQQPPEETQPDPTDLFIRASPSDLTVVQNEQVTIEYLLFFREGIQLRQSRLTDSWDAEGFWREELEVETRPIPQIVVENGRRYNKIVLKRAAVFPTRSGTLVVDSLRIESEAVLPTRSSDPFQLFSLRNSFTPVELASPSVTIESSPLPDGAPESFTGAVGNYQLSTHIDRTVLDVGGSIQYVVTISGTGNLATLDAPAFVPPVAFELYDPQVSTQLNRSGSRLSGTKTFTYVMVPRSNGTFELPAIDFSYYNPTVGEYRAHRSEPVQIIVTGTATTPLTATATTNGLPVDDVAPPVESASHWVKLNQNPVHKEPWIYAALLIPLLLIGVAAIYVSYQNKLVADVGYARKRKAHPLAKKHLKQAKSLLENGSTVEYFAELEHAVLGFLGNRMNISERGLTRAQLDAALTNAGVDSDISDRIQVLLERCDRGRFAPGSFATADLENAFDEAAGLIVETDACLERMV